MYIESKIKVGSLNKRDKIENLSEEMARWSSVCPFGGDAHESSLLRECFVTGLERLLWG